MHELSCKGLPVSGEAWRRCTYPASLTPQERSSSLRGRFFDYSYLAEWGDVEEKTSL